MSQQQTSCIESFFQAFDQIVDAIYLIDVQDARVLHANRAGLDQLKMSMEQVCQQTVFSLQRDVLDLDHWQKITAAIRQDSPFVFVGRHVRSDDSEFAVEVVSHFVEWDGVEYLLSEVRNIIQRQALDCDFQARGPMLSFVLNGASDGMWDWTIPTGEVFFSPQLKRMLGYGPYEMPPVVETWKNNIHPDDLERVMGVMEEHLSGKSVRFEVEYRLANRNGSYLWMHDRGQVCQVDADGNPERVVGMVHNIDEQKQLEHRLRALATKDELTGLLNRRAGYAAFEQALKMSERHHYPLCITLLDLDSFKAINDQYGHQLGDKALKLVARTFRQRVRSTDILMRWGGEEFLLVMPHTELAAAFDLCEDLRQQLAGKVLKTAAGDIHMTVSCGVTVLSKNNGNLQKLVKEADAALYRAKSLGKNRTVPF